MRANYMKELRFKVRAILSSLMAALVSFGFISLCFLNIFQLDLISLLPLELFYFVDGVQPLLRCPRILKVGLNSNKSE